MDLQFIAGPWVNSQIWTYRGKALAQILSSDIRQPRCPCLTFLSYTSVCSSSVHWATPQPVSWLHASSLLIISCFVWLTSSKDVCTTELLQIGHARSIPLRATFEGRQPARFRFIHRLQNLFTLRRPFLFCIPTQHRQIRICLDVKSEHFWRFSICVSKKLQQMQLWWAQNIPLKMICFCSCFLWSVLEEHLILALTSVISHFAYTFDAPANVSVQKPDLMSIRLIFAYFTQHFLCIFLAISSAVLNWSDGPIRPIAILENREKIHICFTSEVWRHLRDESHPEVRSRHLSFYSWTRSSTSIRMQMSLWSCWHISNKFEFEWKCVKTLRFPKQ